MRRLHGLFKTLRYTVEHTANECGKPRTSSRADQRTNQMNFSGNRYDRDVLREILTTSYLDTYVLEVEDRFGTYGVVGFCIVDRRSAAHDRPYVQLSDTVEARRACIRTYLIRHYISMTGMDFQAHYRRTEGTLHQERYLRILACRSLRKRVDSPG